MMTIQMCILLLMFTPQVAEILRVISKVIVVVVVTTILYVRE